ncbi:MAG: hypothetical protein WDW36_003215 [Sanguina aurantia]
MAASREILGRSGKADNTTDAVFTWSDPNLPDQIRHLISQSLLLYSSPSTQTVKRHLDENYFRYVTYESDLLFTFNRDGLQTAFTLLHLLTTRVDVLITRVHVMYKPPSPADTTPAPCPSGEETRRQPRHRRSRLQRTWEAV